jgi:signal transduction histidine kinase
VHAQVSQETIAGLRAAYMQETNDSAKMYLAGQLANGYRFSKVDDVHIVGLTLNRIGNVYMELEDYRKALDYYQQSAAIFKKRKELIYYNEMSNIGHISTFRHNSEVRIEVKDNGSGIPSAHIKKIFQPFFTTKPTGQGTGLGLSLSYDIIKAHGGEIKVESKEGEGSTFVLTLPGDT